MDDIYREHQMTSVPMNYKMQAVRAPHQQYKTSRALVYVWENAESSSGLSDKPTTGEPQNSKQYSLESVMI